MRYQHYKLFLALTTAGMGVVSWAVWQGALLPPSSGPATSRNMSLAFLATLLGGCWIVTAWVEGLYLEKHLGGFIAVEYAKEIFGITVLCLFWLALMILAANWWSVSYCVVYFLYTLYITKFIQPKVTQQVLEAIKRAQIRDALDTRIANFLQRYYGSRHWLIAGTLSITLAGVSVVLVLFTNRGGLDKPVYPPPPFVPGLAAEFVLAQGIVFIHRMRLYRALDKLSLESA